MKKVKINLVIDGEIEDDSELTAGFIAEVAPDVCFNVKSINFIRGDLYINDVTATCEVE